MSHGSWINATSSALQEVSQGCEISAFTTNLLFPLLGHSTFITLGSGIPSISYVVHITLPIALEARVFIAPLLYVAFWAV
jgi:hypothetical protein